MPYAEPSSSIHPEPSMQTSTRGTSAAPTLNGDSARSRHSGGRVGLAPGDRRRNVGNRRRDSSGIVNRRRRASARESRGAGDREIQIPGPQGRGTGGTLSVVWDRSLRPRPPAASTTGNVRHAPGYCRPVHFFFRRCFSVSVTRRQPNVAAQLPAGGDVSYPPAHAEHGCFSLAVPMNLDGATEALLRGVAFAQLRQVLGRNQNRSVFETSHRNHFLADWHPQLCR